MWFVLTNCQCFASNTCPYEKAQDFSKQESMGSLRMMMDGKRLDLNHPKWWILYLWPIFTHPCWRIIAVFDIAQIMSLSFRTQSKDTRGFLLIGHNLEIVSCPTTPTTVLYQLSWKCRHTSSYTPHTLNWKAGTPKNWSYLKPHRLYHDDFT